MIIFVLIVVCTGLGGWLWYQQYRLPAVAVWTVAVVIAVSGWWWKSSSSSFSPPLSSSSLSSSLPSSLPSGTTIGASAKKDDGEDKKMSTRARSKSPAARSRKSHPYPLVSYAPSPLSSSSASTASSTLIDIDRADEDQRVFFALLNDVYGQFAQHSDEKGDDVAFRKAQREVIQSLKELSRRGEILGSDALYAVDDAVALSYAYLTSPFTTRGQKEAIQGLLRCAERIRENAIDPNALEWTTSTITTMYRSTSKKVKGIVWGAVVGQLFWIMNNMRSLIWSQEDIMERAGSSMRLAQALMEVSGVTRVAGMFSSTNKVVNDSIGAACSWISSSKYCPTLRDVITQTASSDSTYFDRVVTAVVSLLPNPFETALTSVKIGYVKMDEQVHKFQSHVSFLGETFLYLMLFLIMVVIARAMYTKVLKKQPRMTSTRVKSIVRMSPQSSSSSLTRRVRSRSPGSRQFAKKRPVKSSRTRSSRSSGKVSSSRSRAIRSCRSARTRSSRFTRTRFSRSARARSARTK